MPKQKAFHDSKAKERLLRGANRGGKTLATCVEIARAVTGQDPQNRFPKEDGTCYIVGKDGKELGEVLYAKLFRAGAFKMIRDEVTKEWRAYNPQHDRARARFIKPAPPLIPHRFVKEIAWENKRMNIPAIVILHNGWRIHFFSSNAAPPHGSAIHLALFDEEIINQNWYAEIAARLVDHSGYFVWSATPQAGTDQLFELHDRAETQARWPREQRVIEEFIVTLDDNIHQTEEQKREFKSKLNPDEYAVRVEGEFALKSFRVFPEYNETAFAVPYFEIPGDWTSYVGIDPGRQVCAALFMAIPPPEAEGEFAYLFDELYIHNCSAELFGKEMRDKCQGRTIHAFIIDRQESRKYDTGSGRNIEDQYSEALKKYGVSCVRTGHYFTAGAADPKAGAEAIRAWLRPRHDQKLPPRLRVLTDKCPAFGWEILRYRYKRERGASHGRAGSGQVTDIPDDRGAVHLMACLRYLVQDEPEYVPPKAAKPQPSAIVKMARQLMKESRPNSDVLHLGPGMGA